MKTQLQTWDRNRSFSNQFTLFESTSLLNVQQSVRFTSESD